MLFSNQFADALASNFVLSKFLRAVFVTFANKFSLGSKPNSAFGVAQSAALRPRQFLLCGSRTSSVGA